MGSIQHIVLLISTLLLAGTDCQSPFQPQQQQFQQFPQQPFGGNPFQNANPQSNPNPQQQQNPNPVPNPAPFQPQPQLQRMQPVQQSSRPNTGPKAGSCPAKQGVFDARSCNAEWGECLHDGDCIRSRKCCGCPSYCTKALGLENEKKEQPCAKSLMTVDAGCRPTQDGSPIPITIGSCSREADNCPDGYTCCPGRCKQTMCMPINGVKQALQREKDEKKAKKQQKALERQRLAAQQQQQQPQQQQPQQLPPVGSQQ